MSGNGEARRHMDAFVVYEPVEDKREGFEVTVLRPFSLAFAQTAEQAEQLNRAAVPGCRAIRVVECAAEDVLRVGVVACAGILANLVALAQQSQMGPPPNLDPRTLRTRGQ